MGETAEERPGLVELKRFAGVLMDRIESSRAQIDGLRKRIEADERDLGVIDRLLSSRERERLRAVAREEE